MPRTSRIPVSRAVHDRLSVACGYHIKDPAAPEWMAASRRQATLVRCLREGRVEYARLVRRMNAIRNLNAHPSRRRTKKHRQSAERVRAALAADIVAIGEFVQAERRRTTNPRLFMATPKKARPAYKQI